VATALGGALFGVTALRIRHCSSLSIGLSRCLWQLKPVSLKSLCESGFLY
jgi:hypothetical protein